MGSKMFMAILGLQGSCQTRNAIQPIEIILFRKKGLMGRAGKKCPVGLFVMVKFAGLKSQHDFVVTVLTKC